MNKLNRLTIATVSAILLSATGCQMPQIEHGSLRLDNAQSFLTQAFHLQPGNRERRNQQQAEKNVQRPRKSTVNSPQYPVQQSAWQEPQSNDLSAAKVPVHIAEQDAALQLDSPNHPSALQNQLRRPMQPNASGFIADDVRLLPKTATERVIELNGVVEKLRFDLDEIRASLRESRNENLLLLKQRRQMDIRIENLEQQLASYRQHLDIANQKSAEINRQIKAFSEGRQKQIAGLTALVDQLERQLREQSGEPGGPPSNQ